MFMKYLLIYFFLLTTLVKATTINSIKNGNWEDATTWHTGFVPSHQDTIMINHYVVITQNKIISSPTVLFINTTGTVCGDYLLETLCGAKFINYGFMFLNQIKTRCGDNYNTIKCKTSIVVMGCIPSTNGLINYPPNGNIAVWPPVFCQTTDTNWEGGTSIGIEELNYYNLTFYPNPIQNESLKITANGLVKLKLKDVMGKLLQKKVFENNTELDVQELKAGIYFLEIEINNRIVVKKIIKIA